MKKSTLALMLGTAFLTFNACKSELDLDKELKFSKQTVEEQKQKIEESGTEFINAMEGLQETKAVSTVMNLIALSGNNSFSVPMRKLSADIKNARKDAFSNFDKQLRVTHVDEDLWGEYEYNFETEEMEKTKTLTNKFVARFPATPDATKNNAVVTITYSESAVEIPNSDGEKYPSAITFKLTVDSKEVMSADFSGAYHKDGSPKKVTQVLTIETYKWTAQIENNQKTASESYEFKKGSKTLIKSVAELNGKLTVKELEDAFEKESPEDAIDKFAVYFQVMDVAVKAGTTDFKKMVKEGKALEGKNLSDKKRTEQTAEILNKHMVCTAYFVDSNRKFADVEMYVVEDTYEEYYYDDAQGRYTTRTVYEYNLSPRFVLSDGSKVDAAEYVQEGFDDLLDRIEEIINGK